MTAPERLACRTPAGSGTVAGASEEHVSPSRSTSTSGGTWCGKTLIVVVVAVRLAVVAAPTRRRELVQGDEDAGPGAIASRQEPALPGPRSGTARRRAARFAPSRSPGAASTPSVGLRAMAGRRQQSTGGRGNERRRPAPVYSPGREPARGAHPLPPSIRGIDGQAVHVRPWCRRSSPRVTSAGGRPGADRRAAVPGEGTRASPPAGKSGVRQMARDRPPAGPSSSSPRTPTPWRRGGWSRGRWRGSDRTKSTAPRLRQRAASGRPTVDVPSCSRKLAPPRGWPARGASPSQRSRASSAFVSAGPTSSSW
jgi:hypothetical protein